MAFLIFLLIPILGITYATWHLYVLMPFPAAVKAVVCALYVLATLLIVADFARWVDKMPLSLASAVYEIGTTALILLLYVVMVFLVLDIGRLVHLVPKAWLHHNLWTLLVLVVGLGGLFVYGNLHYRNKYRQPLQLTTDKPLGKDMTFVMVSDLHLGYHNRREELRRWVEMINKEHADAVLIAGDIIDISVRPLIEDSMAAELRKLNAPVFACLGNHEYYSGEPEAQRFYDDARIRLLRDTAVVFKNDILIVGRDDRTNARRKSLHDILKSHDNLRFQRNRTPLADEDVRVPSDAREPRALRQQTANHQYPTTNTQHPSPTTPLYTILLDHQPYHLEEAEQEGVDFQFSGHTHHGQVWPISWITERVYEKAFGPHRRGKTHYYISSGLGIWGAKVRIGTRSEYVVATVRKK